MSKYISTFAGAYGAMLLFQPQDPGGTLVLLYFGILGGLIGMAVHSLRYRILEALEMAATLILWTLRSRGRALVSLLRGRHHLAAVQGEGV